MAAVVGQSGDWRIERRSENERTEVHRVRLGDAFATWELVAAGLRSDPDLRAALTASLGSSDQEAFFWECAPRPAAGDAPFAFVLVDAPRLVGTPPDARDFAEHLQAAEGPVATFPNLGGDARLVVPRSAVATGHAHLAAFVRTAPPPRVDALWVGVGEALAAWRREGRGPVWLSTSGLGVPWVHVRLDARPKYYVHTPYRRT